MPPIFTSDLIREGTFLKIWGRVFPRPFQMGVRIFSDPLPPPFVSIYGGQPNISQKYLSFMVYQLFSWGDRPRLVSDGGWGSGI